MRLDVHNLVARYGSLTVLRDVSLSLPAGARLGIFGHNGAGKTTLLKLASGLLRPQSGRVRCGDDDITGQPERAARFIGLMPDPLGVYTDVSAREYLEFFARTIGIPPGERAARIDEVVSTLGLTPWLSEEVETLSAGWQRRLALGRVLLGRAPVLLLDEPAAGLDVAARSELLKLVKQLTAAHRAIVISSHILPELQQLADRFGIINRGRWVEVAPGKVFFSREELACGFGRRHWLMRCRQPDTAREALAALGIAVRDADDQAVAIEAADEAAASAVLRAVVARGVDVFEFRQQHFELTDVVLRTLQQEPPA